MATVLPEEFQGQYDAERVAWLRRRTLWFAGAMIVLWGVLGTVRTVKLGASFATSDRAVVASLISGWLADAVMSAVLRHRSGAATDDTLIVEVSRPSPP
jgi:hypothetical protein